MSNNNNQANNNQTSRFGGSRFGSGNTQAPARSGKAANNNTNRAASRLNSLNRFGRETVQWTVMPLAPAAVHISMSGLGDPFQRLLGHPLNTKMGTLANVVAALQGDQSLHDALSKVLDEAWASYQFEGAALLFPADDEVRKPYASDIHPLLPQPQPQDNNNNKDDEDENATEAPVVEQFTLQLETLRAIDLAFVLNILARTRSHVVVANTPLALESAFLQQTFVCEDPRIVAIAKATGAIEEQW